MTKNNKFYLTTPLYYVNAKPHLGTLYSTLLADVVARWQALQGKKVFFLTGTDEHGQKLQEKAAEHKMEPKAFVDSMVPAFKKVWKRYELDYSKFIRTTDPDHEQGVIAWIETLQRQGDIYKSRYTGLYCVQCERFVPEEEAEQCPECKRGLEEVAEENYFFRLSAYEDKLLSFYDSHPDFIIPKERLNEVRSFVKSGLQDLSISRMGLEWGIRFPGDPEHAVYVWADALINYISAVGYGQTDQEQKDAFAHWWPADLQIMAKDILRFHAVYWPAFLMAADLPLPRKLLVHGYILVGETKMSKSKGNIIDPDFLADSYGVEPIRYYLLRQISVNQDSHFELEDLERRITGDLANSLGNLLNRMVVLALNNGLQEVEAPGSFEPVSLVLHGKCAEAFRAYFDAMDHYQFHTALAAVWKFIAEVNAFFNQQKPWEAAKDNQELFKEIISATAHSLYAIGIMVWPVMPTKMEALLQCIGHSIERGTDYDAQLRENKWNKTFRFSKMEKPLFVKFQGTKKG